MIYLALLRGINVGGKRKVDMKSLRSSFERSGMKDVSTYINSGNIIFKSDIKSVTELTRILEDAIELDFGFLVKVLILSKPQISKLGESLPANWINDKNIMKCDVIFLWSKYDNPEILQTLNVKDGIDNVIYRPGAIFWQIDKENLGKSGLMKLVGTELYKNMTIRNSNTFRKLNAIMSSLEG